MYIYIYIYMYMLGFGQQVGTVPLENLVLSLIVDMFLVHNFPSSLPWITSESGLLLNLIVLGLLQHFFKRR